MRLQLLATLALAGCVSQPLPPEEAEHRAAAVHLKEAGAKTTPAGQRAALYLASAAESYDLLDSPKSREAARVLYNKAAADLVLLLRSSDNGAMWNKPLTLTSGGTTWRLRYAAGNRNGTWDPGRFTSFTAASEVGLKTIDSHNRQDGIGGALVGVRKVNPKEPFAPPIAGITAPVTAVLDFKGRDATLTLVDPSEEPKARVKGSERTLDANFSAPLAYYPQRSEFWTGLMGALPPRFVHRTALTLPQQAV